MQAPVGAGGAAGSGGVRGQADAGLDAGSATGAGAAPIEGGAGSGNNPWITFDAPTVVARSDIALARPNTVANEFMPIGNGTLGAAVWAAGGFTAQLNHWDTFPDRKSPGWLTIP